MSGADTDAMEGLRFVVLGRVQGVWFRAFTREQATELGLAGWVRNREDGAVEGEAWGTAAALEVFRERLRQGPPAARVEKVLVDRLEMREPAMAGERFEVRY